MLRPQTFGALAAFQHYDNERLVGLTQGDHVYFCYRVREGAHHLVARSDNDATLDLFVRSGERHFVRLKVNVGPDELFYLGDDEALPMLAELRYVVASPTMADIPAVCSRPIPAACRGERCPSSPEDCPAVLTPL